MRIVYVEDNIANVHLVKRVARVGKHEVINYIDGMDALNNFQSDKPDLVLMDIQLAGELTGLEVVKKLRSKGIITPIIAVTAYAMVGDKERCLEAGCNGYISKPIPVSELVELFNKYNKLKKTGMFPKAQIDTQTTKPVKPAEQPTSDKIDSPDEQVVVKLTSNTTEPVDEQVTVKPTSAKTESDAKQVTVKPKIDKTDTSENAVVMNPASDPFYEDDETISVRPKLNATTKSKKETTQEAPTKTPPSIEAPTIAPKMVSDDSPKQETNKLSASDQPKNEAVTKPLTEGPFTDEAVTKPLTANRIVDEMVTKPLTTEPVITNITPAKKNAPIRPTQKQASPEDNEKRSSKDHANDVTDPKKNTKTIKLTNDSRAEA